MNKKVLIEDLGRRDYKETWDFQELLFKETVDQKQLEKVEAWSDGEEYEKMIEDGML